MFAELYCALLARLVPRVVLVEVIPLLPVLPVLAQEENRTGQSPATIRRNFDFILLTFIYFRFYRRRSHGLRHRSLVNLSTCVKSLQILSNAIERKSALSSPGRERGELVSSLGSNPANWPAAKASRLLKNEREFATPHVWRRSRDSSWPSPAAGRLKNR
jgi:hypothetical protein